MADAVRTTCPYCGTGCGVLASPSPQGWSVSGDPDHPANGGRLCSKGLALDETLSLETRLLHPTVDGRRVSWADAMAETAGRIRSVIEINGPDSFAFYLSGQLLTEDYYAANKLAKGFLGTANVDTNSRLCMASTVAGHRRAFGSDTVPGCYEDLELADLVVLVGSNLAWCHPVLFQRLRAARAAHGTKVVVIDPRRTETCDIADLHIRVTPDGDVALFNALLVHCAEAGVLDQTFIVDHTSGFADTLAAARAENALEVTDDIRAFFQVFAATSKSVTVFSQGVNQSASGSDKVNAIINVHLATGRIGKPGMGPFSVTGQPNAMGGREVGGLANQLAAHMGFDTQSVDRVARFWSAPAIARQEGMKAVDMFRAVDEGRIKAIWIMGTNPAVSMPDAALVRRALAKCPVVIVSDCAADTDTLRFAQIRLPAAAWGEKSGMVTNSDRTMSRQRAFLPFPADVRPDWQAIAQVAAHLGFGKDFAWDSPEAVFREYAALTAFENGGRRDLDLGFTQTMDYDDFAPVQWGERRLFANGAFYTADGRARLVPVQSPSTVESPDSLRLNTGRYRDQWHTMTRTGLSPRLSGHRPQPVLDIHPEDAKAHGVTEGALTCITGSMGRYIAKARLTDAQTPGQVFLPMHWNKVYSAQAVIGDMVAGVTDPISGQPALKAGSVRVAPFPVAWSGLLIAAKAPLSPDVVWWVRHRQTGAEVVEMAGAEDDQLLALMAALNREYGTNRLEVVDPARGVRRHAWFHGDRLVAALFTARQSPEVVASWVAQLVGQSMDTPLGRMGVLAGKPPELEADHGAIVCACFSVGLKSIERAIRDHHLVSVAAIGAHLRAGTGCGSCVPELTSLLSQHAPPARQPKMAAQ